MDVIVLCSTLEDVVLWRLFCVGCAETPKARKFSPFVRVCEGRLVSTEGKTPAPNLFGSAGATALLPPMLTIAPPRTLKDSLT
jgi:hypothetical protein